MSGCLIIPDKETAKARRELFGNSEQLDTISRQAAIDELERGKDKKAKGAVGGFYNQIIDHDIEKLRRLPSAQQWIPCSERMPKEKINQNTQDFEFVLCSTTFGDVRPYKFGKPIGWEEAHFWHGGEVIDKYVVAWMPLPKPYIGEEGDGNEQDRVSG